MAGAASLRKRALPFFDEELRMSSLFASFTTGHTIVCDGGVLC
jgi:hypothetical protein